MTADLLVRNATLPDGRTNVDVLAAGGRIVNVAQRIDGRTLHELDTGSVSLMIAGVAMVAAVLGWLLGVRYASLVGWTAATLILVAADALVFAGLRTILPFSLLLVAWFLGTTAGRMTHILVMHKQSALQEGSKT